MSRRSRKLMTFLACVLGFVGVVMVIVGFTGLEQWYDRQRTTAVMLIVVGVVAVLASLGLVVVRALAGEAPPKPPEADFMAKR